MQIQNFTFIEDVFMAAQIVSFKGSKLILQVEVNFSSSMLQSEINIQKALNQAGTLATGELLKSFDTDGSPITVGPVTMTSKGVTECAYQSSYGEVVIDRHVYQTSRGGKTFCPMEQNARIIVSATPFFAKQISSKYANNSVSSVVTDLQENHGRAIAKGFVMTVAGAVGSVAEAKEETWEYSLPSLDSPVKTIGIGIDGTCMLTVTDGWRVAMTGTISLYDKKGERLHTIYAAATPEYGKTTFLDRMDREIERVIQQFPRSKIIGIADGAKDNWPYLEKHTDEQVLDFWHVTEYLAGVAEAVFVKKDAARKAWLEESCHKLKHNITGPTSLLKEMKEFLELDISELRKEKITKAINYFINNKKRMKYAEHISNNEPIGSGVTEAACKVLVKQRLCNSGMRWKENGASAVLSLRSLNHTAGRWEQFWGKIDASGFPIAA